MEQKNECKKGNKERNNQTNTLMNNKRKRGNRIMNEKEGMNVNK